MNRRSFFKVVTGFVAGIFATSVEGKKFNTKDFGGWHPKDGWQARKVSQDIYGDPDILRKRSGTKYIGECSGQNGTLCPRCKFNTKWIDVRAYSANGSKDDTTAIQEAIGSLGKDGGCIYLSEGTYNIKV
ncbi:MAG: hypothetical protein KAS32_07750 [Candidatus Peribacteraceae bacterium]|nr:hypothetical protein [Candidatus Peribacteraceae bacterium]